ncbi:CYTH and CHAD domain-containing protein [Phenylobacterium immobile]|uniref:CYTH and CHAD domain-containing protein n=1 Tax=Phenylobacterium immobile TaxID=21 RepID=UPI000ACC0539|nr:CYTH and CHAD domain-containing protein [Phenylobacterium immobile]
MSKRAPPSEPEEVELKLLLDPADVETILAAAPAGEEVTRELVSVYFDTADRVLQQAGVSLRVRDGTGRHVQTLKRGFGVARQEYEVETPTFAPDPRMPVLRRLLKQAADPTLRPLFSVAVTRRQRTLSFAGATIELALDEGELRAGRVTRPIHELELELKAGPRAALFALAQAVGEAAPLYLSFDTKAARGQALAAGEDDVTPPVVRLDAGASALTAFQAIAGRNLGRLASAANQFRVTPLAARPVHQLRVAVRTLRSALDAYAAILGDGEDIRLDGELKWLAKSCDRLRDLDVFLTETVEPARPGDAALAELTELVLAARQAAAAQLLDAVSGPRFRTLVIDFARWLETGAWLEDSARAGMRDRPAQAFAAKILAKGRRRLLKKSKGLAKLAPDDRHRARIAAKKLRYAAEGAAALYPKRKTKGLIEALKAMQAALGSLNDISAARRLVQSLAPSPAAAEAALRLIETQAQDEGVLLAQAAKGLKAVRRARLPG